ncbi:DUF1349 domain-containing protein [Rhizobium vallis]|uniref:DUF1349 domain-containing protein n=1 Tax=Rhizobium vallis TaxID=634290 RepID=A0A3S0R5V4_9HYPH|nr:DUF1349 domain-containing protein [Rhizobium vallis]RUM20419.1 DUF1349 domain-containing protein [Rhizobium vallis]
MDLTTATPLNKDFGTFIIAGDSVEIEALSGTNYFVSPDGSPPELNAPSLEVTITSPVFVLQAKVTATLSTIYDAGGLIIRTASGHWAKLVYELSALNAPTIVSVVTQDTSDDCNSEEPGVHSVFLRIHKDGNLVAFHWSLDGRFWKMVRIFAVGSADTAFSVGLLAQAPLGQPCRVKFEEIATSSIRIQNLRNGR